MVVWYTVAYAITVGGSGLIRPGYCCSLSYEVEQNLNIDI